MSLAFGAHVSVSGGVDKAFARAEEFQMDGIQIFSKNERQWRAKPLADDVIERWFDERERTGISKIVAHASYLINLATPREDLREKSLAAFLEELDRCEMLDIPSLVIHPGAHTGSGEDVGVKAVADALNQVHELRPDHKVRTLLETTAGQGTTLGRTFEELAAIIDQVEAKERVMVCLDTCHVFAAGYDIRRPESYAAVMLHFAHTIGIDRLQAIHLNDSQNGPGTNKDRHEHIGQGEIGLEGFRNIVNDPRLIGVPGLLETEKGENNVEDGRNLARLRDLAERPVGTTAE
ncbi:MAG TPA: deoxyribonuclease IV [Thermomicrobiales bacterium]|nr:deoxyribonuclease IV [Thermomicrobiales bacterium]